jgi:tryptophanyl-tRNA synthetase
MEEHREKGGNPDVDVAYQYLQFFMEDDEVRGEVACEDKFRADIDQELAKLNTDYRSGKLLTGEVGVPSPTEAIGGV